MSAVCLQGTEIFIVYAKDGDQGNPRPIHYSIVNGKQCHNFYGAVCANAEHIKYILCTY